MRLNAIKKNSVYGDMPNLLLQKWCAPEFTCVTKLDLSNLADGDEAGVISMGMTYGLVTFKKNGNTLAASYVTGVQKYGKIVPDETIETVTELAPIDAANAGEVFVKYTVKRTGLRDLNANEKDFPLEIVTIEYSTDGNDYQKAGDMTAIPGRWVGVKNGVFCASEKDGSTGYAVVDSVIYQA